MLTLQVNGTIHQLEVDPGTPLLWVLRNNWDYQDPSSAAE